jgi:hypothetical protein
MYAFSSALDLEHATGSQSARELQPEAIVVADPVQRGGRDDRVDWLIELKLKHVLTPHARAVREPSSAAANVEHRRILRDTVEPREHLRRPRLLGLTGPIVRVRIPRSAHRIRLGPPSHLPLTTAVSPARAGDAPADWPSPLSADFAALYPHMPCAPAPGGVAAEHR